MTTPIVTTRIDFSNVEFTVGFRPGIETSSHFVGVDDGWTNPVTHYLDSVPSLVARRLTEAEAERRVRILNAMQERYRSSAEYRRTFNWPYAVAFIACQGECDHCGQRVDLYDGLTALDEYGSPLAYALNPNAREYVCEDCARGL